MKKYISLLITFLALLPLLQSQPIHYVRPAATGANDGTSWADAFTDLQAALSVADSGDMVWVAQGVYRPTAGTDRTVSFEPKSGVGLYGGFSGTETALPQRDWNLYPTVLSGDIGTVGDSLDNSYNVVYLSYPDSATVLDGLVIEWGNADGPANQGYYSRPVCGGGVYVSANNGGAYPTLRDCRIRHCTAKHMGGGALMQAGGILGSLGPTMHRCTFEYNRAGLNGGGLLVFNGSRVERGVDYRHCTFAHNTAGNDGAGMYYQDTNGTDDVEIKDCSFLENRAGHWGGGLYYSPIRTIEATTIIDSCSFLRNVALSGAALNLFTLTGATYEGGYTVSNCAFINNEVPESGVKSIVLIALVGTSNQMITLKQNNFSTIKRPPKLLDIEYFTGDVKLAECSFTGPCGFLFITGENTTSVEHCRLIGGSYILLGNIDTFFLSDVAIVDSSDLPLLRTLESPNASYMRNSLLWNIYDANPIVMEFNFHLPITNSIFSRFVDNYDVPTMNIKNSYIEGMDVSDPAFQNIIIPQGPLYTTGVAFRDTANNDYTLLPCSPLINAGDDTVVPPGSTDLAGNPRIRGAAVDIGPYESAPLSFPPAGGIAAVPACTGASNGALLPAPENACPPLTAAWASGNGTGSALDNLPAGTYAVTLTDAKGETATATATVPVSEPPQATLQAGPVICGTAIGGSIVPVAVQGPNPPHAFAWSGGSTDSVATGLAAGTYALTLTDARGCTGTASATVGRMGTIQVGILPTEISCPDAQDGTVTVQPLDGLPPYRWLWASGDTTATVSGLAQGMHSGFVEDALGCALSFNVPLEAPDSLRANATVTPASGPAAPDGAVALAPSGGTGNLVATWPDGTTGNLRQNLLPGTYALSLSDANGCTAAAAVEVPWTSGSHTTGTAPTVRVFPVPARSQVSWTGLPEGAPVRARLYAASGALVLDRHCTGATLPMDGVAAGMYWLELVTADGAVWVKVVK